MSELLEREDLKGNWKDGLEHDSWAWHAREGGEAGVIELSILYA